MQSIDSLSREYVLAAVTATNAGAPYNPTADVVEFAFTAQGAKPTTWYTGSWDTTPIPGTSSYNARCLIGPGGTTTLTVGKWVVWLRITDSPEVPVRKTGLLTVT